MRLTEKKDNGHWILKDVSWDELKPGVVLTKEIWKLKDYEDTGLMPNEVTALNVETQKEARKMLERVAKLSDEIEQQKHGGDHGIKFFINKAGIADVYDDTYDIVIHCENEEDQKDAEEALKKIRRWIPVTERLPEPETYVLVSFDNSTTPDIATYRVDDDGSGAFYLGDEDYTYLSAGLFVNAWMPLPKPYMAEMEEN
ncbi:putative uncharacterized protein [Clostridium sp. CAG:81]|nr:putative uncharacterized protein [Clostridium sp. CAG:81]